MVSVWQIALVLLLKKIVALVMIIHLMVEMNMHTIAHVDYPTHIVVLLVIVVTEGALLQLLTILVIVFLLLLDRV